MVAEYFDTLSGNATVGATLIEADGSSHRIADANERFGELTGYNPEDAVGRECCFFQGDRTDRARVEKIRSAIARGKKTVVELRGYRKDGTQFWCRFHVIPVDRTADPELYLCLQDDVTENKTEREELKRQNERLKTFARTVSHDLRNPLSMAMTNAELADRTGSLEYLDEARQALTRMEAIIQTTLEASTSGGDHQQVNVANVAKAAWSTTDTQNGSLDIEVSATILANESRLQQLFENLFDNAIKHGGSDATVRVGSLQPVTTSTRETSTEITGLFVADDGSGLPDPILEEGIETGAIEDEVDHGYGLDIVENIVEDHDWQLYVSESEDGGARFEIEGIETAD